MSRRSAAGAKAGHLDATELVDALDSTLTASRLQHLETCAPCRDRADELRLVMTSARVADGEDVPEPAPLFWDQFSARVRDAVAGEPAPRPAFWQFLALPRVSLAAAALAAIVIVSVALWQTAERETDPAVTSTAASAGISDLAADEAADDFDSDEAWALVRAMADEIAPDDLDGEGMSSGPGAAEHLVLRLNEQERVELARLLEEQTKRPAKTDSAS